MVELAASGIAEQIGATDPLASASGATVRLIAPASQHYVTGAGPLLAPNMRDGVDPYWLWLAPDRVLLVGIAQPAILPEGGFISDVTDGLAIFEIEGPQAGEIIAMGCTLDAAGPELAPGRCAQTSFAGVRALLYAQGSRTCFRLHAERSLAAYLTEWFTQAASALR
jgi:heterotetrameric sarcosine oxidase gamma subunit